MTLRSQREGKEQETMRDKGCFVTSSEDSVSLRKGEKRNSDERETSKMVLKRTRQGISRLFQIACTTLRNMILSKELSRQTHTTYSTLSHQIEQNYPLLKILMAQQVVKRVPFNGEMT